MIVVEGLVFEYPGLRALDDISFSLATGGITALVGPNGAGKTTLLRCLAALEAPFAGRILLDGRDLQEDPRRAHRQLGYLSDFFGLYDELSVRQCLTYRARAQGVAGREVAARVEAVGEELHLADRLEVKAGALSRGLRQRLGIAQALVHRPRLLLLDEPASGLDPEAREQLSVLLRRLNAGGMTIVVSSHILAELADYSDAMLIVDRGRLVDHRAVAGAAQAAAEQEITLSLARPEPRLAAILEATPGIATFSCDGAGARLSLAGGAEAAAEVLARLIQAGLAVAAFVPARRDLQEAYLEGLRKERREGGS